MNNNDIVQELQRRGYKAELHEVMKNGVHLEGIVIISEIRSRQLCILTIC